MEIASSESVSTDSPITVDSSEIPRKRPASLEITQSVKHFKFSTVAVDASFVSEQTKSAETYDETGNDKHSCVVKEFNEVKNKLCNILALFDVNSVITECTKLMASSPDRLPLFMEDTVKCLLETKTTPRLICKLASFTNWLDHSILNTIVEVCKVPEATTLLAKFDRQIDPIQPLIKYPIPSPSHNMVPYDTSTHTVLAVQLNLQLHHSTLQNVLDTRALLQQQCHITVHCLQLLAVANTSHTIIYWTIPKHVAGLITSSVLQHQTYLYQNGIEQVAVYPGTTLVTGSSLTVGLFSFFTEVSFSDSILLIINHCR